MKTQWKFGSTQWKVTISLVDPMNFIFIVFSWGKPNETQWKAVKLTNKNNFVGNEFHMISYGKGYEKAMKFGVLNEILTFHGFSFFLLLVFIGTPPVVIVTHLAHRRSGYMRLSISCTLLKHLNILLFMCAVVSGKINCKHFDFHCQTLCEVYVISWKRRGQSLRKSTPEMFTDVFCSLLQNL